MVVKYYKSFWMLNREDKEYNDCNLNGYARIETKRDKLIVNVTVFNIKNNLRYKVYLMNSSNENFYSLCVGHLKINKNIGALEYVANLSYDVNKFNVLAVVSIIENENDIKMISPVVAYKDKKVPWRENLKNEIKKLGVEDKTYYCPIMAKKVNFNFLNHLIKMPNVKNKFNLEIFKRQVDINFRRCDPFLNKRQDYIWWIVKDIRKLYYFLKLFGVDIKNNISSCSNIAILGLYENNLIGRVYIILGVLIKNDNCVKNFDKIVEVKNSSLKYGLVFLNPYLEEQVN